MIEYTTHRVHAYYKSLLECLEFRIDAVAQRINACTLKQMNKHRVFSSNPLASYIFLVYVLLYILWLIHIDDKCKDVVMIKKTVILYIKVKCYNISHKESFNENMHKSILFYFVIRIEIKTFIPDHDRYTYTTHVIYNWRNSCNAAPK